MFQVLGFNRRPYNEISGSFLGKDFQGRFKIRIIILTLKLLIEVIESFCVVIVNVFIISKRIN